jgi:hypothetical protein
MNKKMIARSKKDILIGIVVTWNLHRLAVLFKDGVPLMYFERGTMEPYQIEVMVDHLYTEGSEYMIDGAE